jgi:hypothetical protein
MKTRKIAVVSLLIGLLACLVPPAVARPAMVTAETEIAIQKGLDYLAKAQRRRGSWAGGTGYGATYEAAMTGLAGVALLSSGSTPTRGPYNRNIYRAILWTLSQQKASGLICSIAEESRSMYGHGFSMLFLSQVLGEEQDEGTRQLLIEILNKAVDFSCKAQTRSGGWGYVSAKDGNDFDEGSTTITQVQGLRGCRNAGIPVPAEVIERAKKYIYDCKNPDGGISYSSRNRGSSRPAITAAALAALYNAGAYDSEHVPDMLEYCKKTLGTIADGTRSFGHWHYTYLYYAQVVYRQGRDEWNPFRDKLYNRIIGEQNEEGYWAGNIGPIYVTSCNLIILQLDKAYVPIYQR